MANRNARLLTKRTSVPGKTPTGTTGSESSFIQAGELASNLADHTLWGYDGTNVFEYGSNSFLALTGGTITGDTIIIGNLSASTLFSGSTDLYDIFLTTADGNDITRVQPGANIITGGTGNSPIISTVDSPSFNNIEFSGTAIGGSASFDGMSATTLYSGSTDVETIIRTIADGSDTFVTGATLSADTTFILSRNDGVDVATDLTIQRAISLNAEAFVLDSATRVILTPIVISVVRFVGTGQPDTAGVGFTVPVDYKDGGAFSYIWRSSTTSTTLSAKTSYDMYTGDTSNTGSLVTSAESFSISDTPKSNTNIFIYSPNYTPTTTLSPGMKIHLTITRDPGDAGDTLNSNLDMTDFVFTYNALR